MPAEMSGGEVTISRYRIGTDADWTPIVADVMIKAAGEMTYDYTWPDTQWESGDWVMIENAPVTVTRGLKTLTQGPFRSFTKMA
jgi:hypothetical protein